MLLRCRCRSGLLRRLRCRDGGGLARLLRGMTAGSIGIPGRRLGGGLGGRFGLQLLLRGQPLLFLFLALLSQFEFLRLLLLGQFQFLLLLFLRQLLFLPFLLLFSQTEFFAFLLLLSQFQLLLLLLPGHFNFLLPALFGGRMRQRLARRGQAGVALDRLVVVGNRLGVLTLLFVSKAALVIGLRILRVDLDGTIEIVDGLGVAVGTHQRRGAGAQRGGIFRLAFERGIVIGNGGNRLAGGLFDLCTIQRARAGGRR